jgi:hypothetical protein
MQGIINEITKIVRENVKAETIINTDERAWYKQFGAHFMSHDTVNHGRKEYAQGEITDLLKKYNIQCLISVAQHRRSGFHRFANGSMLFRFPSGALSHAEGIMPIYRAYLIDKDDKVDSYKPVEADSDEGALEAAKQLLDGHDFGIEVWLLDRIIGSLGKRV